MENNIKNIISSNDLQKLNLFFNEKNIYKKSKGFNISLKKCKSNDINYNNLNILNSIFLTENYNNNILYINSLLNNIFKISLNEFNLYEINYKELGVSQSIYDNKTKTITNIDLINTKDTNHDILNLYKYNNIFYIDIKKLKYSNYGILFTILDYYINTNKIVANDDKYIFILNNIHKFLDNYAGKLINYLEKDKDNYSFILFNDSKNNIYNKKYFKIVLKFKFETNDSEKLFKCYNFSSFIREFINKINLLIKNNKQIFINLKKKNKINVKNYNKIIKNGIISNKNLNKYELFIQSKCQLIYKYTSYDIVKTYIIIIKYLYNHYENIFINLENILNNSINNKTNEPVESNEHGESNEPIESNEHGENNETVESNEPVKSNEHGESNKSNQSNKSNITLYELDDSIFKEMVNINDINLILTIPLHLILNKLILLMFNLKNIKEINYFNEYAYKLLSLSYEINIIFKGFINQLTLLNKKNIININYEIIMQIIKISGNIEHDSTYIEKPFIGLTYFFIETYTLIFNNG